MPTRTPIIPGPGGSRRLLRALHTEMKEKKLIKEQTIAPYPDSGVHSSSSSDVDKEGDVTRDPVVTSSKAVKSSKAMTQGALEAAQSDSSTCTDTEESDAESQRDDRTSSDYDARLVIQHQRALWANRPRGNEAKTAELKRLHGKMREVKTHDHQMRTRRSDEGASGRMRRRTEELLLTERDRQQLREGYSKFVLHNGEQVAGTSFGTNSAFAKVPREEQRRRDQEDNSSSSDELQFPLESAAGGGSADVASVRDARRQEKEAKQKTKTKKKSIAEAKMAVAEAKLSEFSAKLNARQARVDSSHAKMCRRRAVLKRAEERLLLLESRLDAEEEEHRERERRIRNRERRVRQEEAGLQIKEASLKKREEQVTESIQEIESRRKLVEEKEQMLEAMEDIMTKREDIQQRKSEERSKVGRVVGSLGKKILRSAKHANHADAGITSSSNNIRSAKHSNHVDSSITSSSSSNNVRSAKHSTHVDAGITPHFSSSSNKSAPAQSNHVPDFRSAPIESEKTPRSRQERMSSSGGSHHQGASSPSAPVPTPRKSLPKRSSEGRARSNSLNSDVDDDVRVTRKPALATGSLPRFKGQKAVMGLWL